MDFRRVEIDCPKGSLEDIQSLEGGNAIAHCRIEAGEGDFERITLLVKQGKRQQLLDAIEERLHGSDDWRIVVLPVEGVLPLPDGREAAREEEDASDGPSREEVFNQVRDGARLNVDVALLLAASSVVACGGILTDSTPVTIGAMLIAPMIGPILSLVLGNSLGERWMILRSLAASAIGVGIAFAVGVLSGLLFEVDPGTGMIARNMQVGLEDVVLALASGAAAALSVTSRQVAVMVGVMVAAALLPPIVTAGILFGEGLFELSGYALLLALTNIVGINLAGQLVFIWKGVRPRTWYERKKARQSVAISLGILVASLVGLAAAIYFLGEPGVPAES